MDETTEEWLPIPGYEEQYEVSNQFRVRRLARMAEHGMEGFKRVLAARLLSVSNNNGYLVVYLCRPGHRKRAKKFYIEAAVEKLFPGTLPKIQDISEPGEEWRPISGYEGLYEVSSIGRIKSVGWYVNGGAKRRYARPRIRIVGIGSNGYPKVELAIKGRIRTVSIHRLVATAFIPNPLNLPIVHHKDEDRTNNRVENLEWATAEKNIGDWFDRRRVVITPDTIERIALAHASGKTPAEILSSLPRRRKPLKK